MDWRGRRVLITGHTGFKGAWLTLWLTRLGATVTGVALPPPSTPNLFDVAGVAQHCDSRIGDIRDAEYVARTTADVQPDIVLHLAAQTLVRESYRAPVETFASNVMGTVHVLDAVRRVPSVRVVLVVTSDKCYENHEWPWPYRETDPLGGHDPYSASKGAAEIVTAAYRRSFLAVRDGSPVVVATARAGNVIGGGDWASDRLIPDIVRAFSAGEPVVIRNPAAVRPWQHVLDALHGYLTLVERAWDGDSRCAGAWNFGPTDGETRPVSWVVDQMVSRWREQASWVRDPTAGPHEAALLRLDSSRARGQLGWAPHLDLGTALDWTVDWYKGHYSGGEMAAVTADQIDRFRARSGGDDRRPSG